MVPAVHCVVSGCGGWAESQWMMGSPAIWVVPPKNSSSSEKHEIKPTMATCNKKISETIFFRWLTIFFRWLLGISVSSDCFNRGK